MGTVVGVSASLVYITLGNWNGGVGVCVWAMIGSGVEGGGVDVGSGVVV